MLAKYLSLQSARLHLLLLLSGALPLVVSLVLAPIVTSVVTNVQYGQYVNYLLVCSIASIFVGISSAGYVSNMYIEPSAGPKIAGSMLVVLVASALIVLVALIAAAALHRALDVVLVGAIAIAGLSSYAVAATQAYATLLTKYQYLFRIAGVQAAVQITTTLVFVLVWGFGTTGLVLAHVSALVASAAYCVIAVNRALGVRIGLASRATCAGVIAYGLPLVPHLLLSLGTGTFDRWYLASASRLGDLAVYSVAASVAVPVMVVLDVVNKAYSPAVFRRLRGGVCPPPNMRSGALIMMVAGLGVATVVAAAGYAYIALTFGAMYQAAASLCVMMCYASSPFALYYAAAPYLYYYNRTGLILLSSAAGAVVTVAATLVLHSSLDLVGLIAAKAAGFAVTGLAALAMAARVRQQRLFVDYGVRDERR